MFDNKIENLIKGTVSALVEITQNMHNFAELMEKAHQTANDLCRRFVEESIVEFNRKYDLTRNKNEINRSIQNQVRILKTQIGEVIIERTLYFDKKNNRYFYPVDELLQIESHNRLDKNLRMKILSDSKILGIARAAEMNQVSRQTVYNLLKEISEQGEANV